MLKIQQVDNLENKILLSSNFTKGNYSYFFVYDFHSSIGDLTGILKYDIINGEIVENFKIKEKASVIDNNFGQNYSYYINIYRNERDIDFNIYQIDFQKMDCKKVFNLNRCDSLINNLEDTEINCVEIIGIDDRYCIFAVPNLDTTKIYNSDDSGHLLIDIKEQKSYKIPKLIGSKDYINNLSFIKIFEISGESHIMLVTGRISSWEKRDLWDNNETDNLPWRTKFQSVSLLPLSSFIKNIKYNQSINEDFIIHEFDMNSALIQIEIHGSNLYIYKEDFKKNISELYTKNLEDKKNNIFGMTEVYHKIIFDKDKPCYGLKKLDDADELHDLYGEKELFRTNEKTSILGAYRNIIITREYRSVEGRVILKLIDLEKEEIITKKIGKLPGVYYLTKLNTLLLF